MRGILVYREDEIRRNAFAVAEFEKHLCVKTVTENYRGAADFVINRSNNYEIAKHYEDCGVRVFNPAKLTKIANDKQACYDLMEKNGIEILPTRYSGIPAVKKPVAGHGGQGVIMLESAEEFEPGYVYQKPADTLGKDLRVWLIGGKIITAVLRESESDFRSNFCLGANAVPYSLSGSERTLVLKISSLIKSDYIGIDFVFNNGSIVFNEIEDAVGARMVYAKTDIDILNLYCEYIKERISEISLIKHN